MAEQIPPDDQQDYQGIDIEQSQIAGGVANQSGQKNKLVQGNGNTWIEQFQVFLTGQQAQGQPIEPQRSKSEQILLQGIKDEVEERLEQSLHNHIYIPLDQEKATDLVDVVWHRDIKSGVKTERELLENVAIAKIFDETRGHRLLILGEPGSGKTTTLLTLAKTLIERAETDTQKGIPVLLNLSSWQNDKQSITDWIIDNLKFKYGIRPDISKQWLDEKVILPLLDGLDELKAERQEICIQKVNEFLSQVWQVGEVVVCSRREEYELQTSRFMLSGSIILQPLTEVKIKDFICRTEGVMLWENVSYTPEILELAKSPLLLDVIVLAWKQISFEQWQTLTNSETRQAYLWEAYIAHMLSQKTLPFLPTREGKNKYTKQQILHWLRWLAWLLTQQKQTELFLEYFQLQYLGGKISSFLLYGFLVGSLIASYIFPFVVSMTLRFIESLLWCLIFSLSLGLFHAFASYIKLNKANLLLSSFNNTNIELISGFLFVVFERVERLAYSNMAAVQKNIQSHEIRTYESIVFSRKTFCNSLKNECSRSFTIICISFIALFISIYFSPSNPQNMINIILFLISFSCLTNIYLGIIISTIEGFRGPKIKYKILANQGISKSRSQICIVSLILSASFTLFLLLSYLFLVYFSPLRLMEVESLIQTGCYIFSFNFIYTLLLCSFDLMKYLALRISLYLQAHIAWNYSAFLDYCTDRLLIQRVGGGYRFIHRFLQEHLATQYEASLKLKKY